MAADREGEMSLNIEENAVWGTVRSELEVDLGKDAFRNWIAPLELSSITDNALNFTAPIGYIGRYVDRHYSDQIIRFFATHGIRADRLNFSVGDSSVKAEKDGAEADRSAPAAAQDDAEAETFSGAPLDPRFTFDTFIVGKPNELAAAAARRAAEPGPAVFNPLFLYGGVGLGKTHLMHAIAWSIRAQSPQARVLYLTAEQFMFRFIQALRFRNTIEFKSLFRSVDVLMIDDVQFIAGKDSTQDEFFHTFNALIEQKKRIIISADRAPGEIDGMEERIRSRLQWGLVADLHPTDYELRLGILQAKVDAYLNDHPDLQIDPQVLEFLAHRISSNVRVLEGALTRLFAFGSLVGRRIDMDLAQECLADVLRASQQKITVEEIIRKVCDHYNLRMSDIMSPRRARAVARPRQMAMFLSKMLTSKSLPDIGRRFGGRDHTTVLHAVRKIEELQHTDSQIAEDVELLRRMLEA